MNTLDKQYQALLQDILDTGVRKEDRTGTGTLSVFGRQIRHKMSEGFPLLTTKKMYWRGIVTELLWFLRGDTNIKFLVDNDCHIWDGDAYNKYVKSVKESIDRATAEGILKGGPDDEYSILSMEGFVQRIKTDAEFAKQWGELGPVYGKQWRSWGRKNVTNYDLKEVKGSDQPKVLEAIKNGEDVTKYGVKIEYQNNSIDQIQNLIRDLKTNPDSRRLMVSAWNVAELDSMTLPPCHYGFQVYTRELSLGERQAILEKRGYSGLLHSNVKNYKSHKKILEVIKQTCDDVNLPTRAISLMWNQRSVDVFLGLPFNIASYGLLLEIIAKEVNMVPDELIGNLGDTHLYLNHLDQAKEQLNREPYSLPKLIIDQFDETNHYIGDMDDVSEYNVEQFKLENYQSHPTIKAALSN
jgi:thymidylate synthase